MSLETTEWPGCLFMMCKAESSLLRIGSRQLENSPRCNMFCFFLVHPSMPGEWREEKMIMDGVSALVQPWLYSVITWGILKNLVVSPSNSAITGLEYSLDIGVWKAPQMTLIFSETPDHWAEGKPCFAKADVLRDYFLVLSTSGYDLGSHNFLNGTKVKAVICKRAPKWMEAVFSQLRASEARVNTAGLVEAGNLWNTWFS